NCLAIEWQCVNGQCIKSNLVCDGTPNCDDKSDEHRCYYACANNKTKHVRYLCDGFDDCGDGSDESVCAFLLTGKLSSSIYSSKLTSSTFDHHSKEFQRLSDELCSWVNKQLDKDRSFRRIPHVCQLLDLSKFGMKAVLELGFEKDALSLLDINYMSQKFFVRVESIFLAGSNSGNPSDLMETVEVARVTSTAVMKKMEGLLLPIFVLYYFLYTSLIL
ncbi:hypothetical protein EG68_02066, partial [Paragonimus skrjabini miyazakii]